MADKRKTAPWIPMDASWWPTIAAEMPTPWTRQAVLMDLRWWADQERMGRKKRPGRVGLRKRWGWTDWQTRDAMRSEGQWGNPIKANLPPSYHSPTTPLPDADANPPESQGAANHTPTIDLPPTSPRADLHKTQAQPQTSEGAKAPLPDKPDPAADTWARMLEIRARHRPKARALKLTSYRRRVLNGRLKDHDAEALLRVTEWHYTSNHTTATWNREQGHDLDTLIRPANFDRYLEFAHSEADHPRPPKPNGRPQYKDIRERLAEAREMREPPPPEVVVVDFTPPPKTGADHG